MKFIKLTLTAGRGDVYIAADRINAVTRLDGGGSRIDAPDYVEFVEESPEAITEMVRDGEGQ